MVDVAVTTHRELAHRRSCGIEVTLYWRQLDDRLTIRVHDTVSGDLLQFEPDPAEALEAFYHPYAYAPERRLDPEASWSAA